MIKTRFTIRTLLIATVLVAALLPTAIAYYDDMVAYLNPPSDGEYTEKAYRDAFAYTGPLKAIRPLRKPSQQRNQ